MDTAERIKASIDSGAGVELTELFDAWLPAIEYVGPYLDGDIIRGEIEEAIRAAEEDPVFPFDALDRFLSSHHLPKNFISGMAELYSHLEQYVTRTEIEQEHLLYSGGDELPPCSATSSTQDTDHVDVEFHPPDGFLPGFRDQADKDLTRMKEILEGLSEPCGMITLADLLDPDDEFSDFEPFEPIVEQMIEHFARQLGLTGTLNVFSPCLKTHPAMIWHMADPKIEP